MGWWVRWGVLLLVVLDASVLAVRSGDEATLTATEGDEFALKPIVIDSCIVTAHEATEECAPGWTLLEGTGERLFPKRELYAGRFFTETQPRAFVGLQMFDIQQGADERLSVKVHDIDNDGVDLLFKTWDDSKVKAAGASYLAFDATSIYNRGVLLQTGEVLVGEYNEPQWRLHSGTGRRCVTLHVTFHKTYRAEPIVVVSLHEFSGRSDPAPIIETEILKVTHTGFDLMICTDEDAVVESVGISWLAHSGIHHFTSSLPILSGSVSASALQFDDVHYPLAHGDGMRTFTKHVTFHRPFQRIPRAVASIHSFNAHGSYGTQLSTIADHVTTEGMDVIVKTWGKSVIQDFGITWTVYDEDFEFPHDTSFQPCEEEDEPSAVVSAVPSSSLLPPGVSRSPSPSLGASPGASPSTPTGTGDESGPELDDEDVPGDEEAPTPTVVPSSMPVSSPSASPSPMYAPTPTPSPKVPEECNLPLHPLVKEEKQEQSMHDRLQASREAWLQRMLDEMASRVAQENEEVMRGRKKPLDTPTTTSTPEDVNQCPRREEHSQTELSPSMLTVVEAEPHDRS